MHTLLALCAVLARLPRPSNGVHVTPFGYVRELVGEFRRPRRARRVRRYTEEAVPAITEHVTRDVPAPRVPAPRKPSDDHARTAFSAAVPVVNPKAVAEPAALVRGHYRDWERRQAQQRVDKNRLAGAPLWDIAAAQKGAA